MKKFFNKKFLASGIGSIPFVSAEEACQFILENFRQDLVFWPQLTRRDFLENMYVQFSQGLPSVETDKNKKTIFINTDSDNFSKALENCLQNYLDSNLDYFLVSEDYASGFYSMLNLIPKTNLDFFKGQLIGPVSFGLSVKDQKQQAIIYNQELYQAVVKVLAMKAAWQIEKIKEVAPKSKIIIFIDEPYLVSVGSSFVSLDKKQIIKDINEVIQEIHKRNAIVGIHCCGNTDWSIILETQVDILSFDAYNYLDNLLLYKNELKKFIDKGGILAWGIVPNSEIIESKVSKKDLINKIKQAIEKSDGILKEEGLITPSCGCGTLDLELAKKIHVLCVEIARELNRN
ncbi:MAG: hypothetical protein ABH954_03700 [Candidatus Omnitrophota bacterium]